MLPPRFIQGGGREARETRGWGEKKTHKVKVFEEAENENVEVMEGRLPLKKIKE